MRKAGSNENLSGKPKLPSEKHDLLYSKARYVLTQRHIKRPWFNLNPFLEKTDESADLENWLPGESKYIQPLESLVLCESFHSDHPVDTKELVIDAFFPYLLSGNWDKGCSIRVLEGQLLEQLLIGLYRLEKEGFAVRHTTYAFARNCRPRTGCYKLIDKEASGSIEETLLLEFAHFGRCTKEMPNTKTLDPLEYLHSEKREFDDSEEFETVSEIPPGLDMYMKRESRAMSFSTASTKGQGLGSGKPKWGRRGSLMSKHLNAIGFLTAFKTMNKRNSIAVPSIPEYRRQSTCTTDSTLHPESRRQIMPTTHQHAARRQTLSGSSMRPDTKRNFTLGQSVASDNRRLLSMVAPCTSDRLQNSSKHVSEKRRESVVDKVPPLQPDDDEMKSTLPKMHKKHLKINSLEFDDDDYLENDDEPIIDIEEVAPPEEKDVFFGEEFYLSDQKKTTPGIMQNSRKILKRKKMELHKRRDKAKKSKEIIKEKSKQSRLPLPPIPSPLDIDKLDICEVKYETIKMPEHVPTLEEFVKLLKEDEYYDPRYRNKMRQKSKKIAQRYYISKGTHRASVLFSLADLPDEIKNITALRKTSKNTLATQLYKQEPCDEKSHVRLSRLHTLSESQRFKAQIPELPGSIENIQERAQEVLAVTDSEPCKDHYVKYKRQSIADAAKVIQCIKKLTPISEPSEKVTPESKRPSISKTTPMFPKPESLADESESSESDSSSEEISTDESLDEAFDTNRLNMKYSIERLRKRRRSKIKKKPAFIEVLAKYYQMQNILRAFRKGSAGKESKRARARARQLGKKARQAAQNKEEMVIGKLKKFNFLEVKPKKRLNLNNLSVGDFSSPDLAKFHQQLRDVLDEFVVRREIVVSDIQTFYSATTSVTFTKLSCFQHKHKTH